MADKKSGLKNLFSKSNKDCCSIEIEEVKSDNKDCCVETEEKTNNAKKLNNGNMLENPVEP